MDFDVDQQLLGKNAKNAAVLEGFKYGRRGRVRDLSLPFERHGNKRIHTKLVAAN
jgi:hypothetical protein